MDPSSEAGIEPDVSEEMSVSESSASKGVADPERDGAGPSFWRLDGGIRCPSVGSTRESALCSRSSVLTSSANSLDACEESGDPGGDSDISVDAPTG